LPIHSSCVLIKRKPQAYKRDVITQDKYCDLRFDSLDHKLEGQMGE
jgi:hypothetical protein